MSLLALLLAAAGPLAASPSPYLREAAASPVHWQLWGPEALAEAKRAGKPLLVDVGAGWCHWCHVMDEGTYALPEIAALINQRFVAVKVDRDLSPDLDARFQRDAERLAGVGGWPLTVFLDPEGHIYSAASYVPAERMPALLQEMADSWKQPSAQALRARALADQEPGARPSPGKAGLELVQKLGDELLAELDPAHGGFGTRGPKFPNGPAVQLALALADRVGGPGPLLDVATLTLDGMARGGVRDHVGGGFHRYSVDPGWNVPHFEKMLYVNAALLSAYVDGWRSTQSEIYREVADELCDYLLSPAGSDGQHGGFYASQDSDVGAGDDGSFYTWTVEELRAAGGDEAVRFFVQPDSGSPGRRVVLREGGLQPHPPELMARLRAARARRPAPRVDETKYASWNGQAIAALLEAGAALGRPVASRAALQALDLFLSKPLGVHGLTSAGAVAGDPKLRRLDDLAELGLAAVAGFETTGRARYLEAAKQLVATADRELWDEASGSYRESNAELRATPGIEDAPTPSPEAAMALLLTRLASLTGVEGYAQRGDRLLAAFAGEAAGHGSFAAMYGLALLERFARGPQVAVVGGKGAEPLRAAAVATWRPGKLVHSYAAGEKAPYPAGPHGAALAYVCGRSSCAPPTADPKRLESLIQSWDR